MSYSPLDPHDVTEELFETASSKNLILPEPSLGDLGCIEENNEEVYDQATFKDLVDDDADLSIKNAELIDLIASNSVKLTEA